MILTNNIFNNLEMFKCLFFLPEKCSFGKSNLDRLS